MSIWKVEAIFSDDFRTRCYFFMLSFIAIILLDMLNVDTATSFFDEAM